MHKDSDPATPEQQAFLDGIEDGAIRLQFSKADDVYVVIHGRKPHTDRSLVDYVDSIVYGAPTKITATEVGESHFVALVEWPAAQWNWAKGTFERMGSFPYGACLTIEKGRKAAIGEFGAWVYHYSNSKEFEYMKDEVQGVDWNF